MRAAAIVTENQKVWFLCLTFMAVGLVASTAVALDPMGPPVARLDGGQVQAGIDYSRGRMDLELADGTWVEVLDGAFFDAGKAQSFTLKNFKANRTYANIGLGITDHVEAFVRVGGTKARFGDSVWQDQEQFESSTDFAIGGGLKTSVKIPIHDDHAFHVGGLVQANWSEYNGTLFAPHWLAADRVEIEIAEVQMAVGAAYTWAEFLGIYAGPFLHFVSGDFLDTFTAVDPSTGGLLTSNYRWEIDEDAILGGYIGAQFGNEHCSFNIEYQLTAGANAVAMSLLFRN